MNTTKELSNSYDQSINLTHLLGREILPEGICYIPHKTEVEQDYHFSPELHLMTFLRENPDPELDDILSTADSLLRNPKPERIFLSSILGLIKTAIKTACTTMTVTSLTVGY